MDSLSASAVVLDICWTSIPVHVFAAAAIAHPNFMLRWVPAENREWAKQIFITEAKKYATHIVLDVIDESIIQHQSAQSTPDTFFDFDNDIPATQQRGSDSEVTIEYLRYLEDSYLPSLDVLQCYPVVKAVFRKLNATMNKSGLKQSKMKSFKSVLKCLLLPTSKCNTYVT